MMMEMPLLLPSSKQETEIDQTLFLSETETTMKRTMKRTKD